MEPNVIPSAEAARQKGCTRQAIYNAIDRGDLTGVRLGTSRLVALDEKYEQYEVKETGGRKHRSYQRQQEGVDYGELRALSETTGSLRI